LRAFNRLLLTSTASQTLKPKPSGPKRRLSLAEELAMVDEDSDTFPEDESESEAALDDNHHDTCDDFHVEQSRSMVDDNDKLRPIHVQVLGPG
jgi:hypothetical protein